MPPPLASPLAQVSGLLKLSISDNALTALPNLSACVHLAELRAGNNKIAVIPKSIVKNGVCGVPASHSMNAPSCVHTCCVRAEWRLPI